MCLLLLFYIRVPESVLRPKCTHYIMSFSPVCTELQSCDVELSVSASCFLNMPKAKTKLRRALKISFCPDCGRRFANETWVLQHLNQPSIACGSWINELSRFHHHLPTPRNHSPVEPEHLPSRSYDRFFASETANDHQGENDDPSLYYPHQDPTMPVIDYHPNTPSVHPGGTVFMDQFFNDQYATLRQENLYYPFASRTDWQLASWLLRSRLSMAAIDDFLSLELVSLLFSLVRFLDAISYFRSNNFPFPFDRRRSSAFVQNYCLLVPAGVHASLNLSLPQNVKLLFIIVIQSNVSNLF